MVKLLLDSNALIWAVRSPEKLGRSARSRIERSPKLWFSAASIFELTLKSQKVGRDGKPLLRISDEFGAAVAAAGFQEIPLLAKHAETAKAFMSYESGDPFDRMILAQAFAEAAVLVTSDERMLALGLDWIIDAQL
ncbi:MAG: type II toxin-antitoxin system VapC family toxin [Rhodoluna sp.]